MRMDRAVGMVVPARAEVVSPTPKRSSPRVLTTVAALLIAASVPATAGEPPYPILFIHGLNSSHLMWTADTLGTDESLIQALGLRFGATGYPTEGRPLEEQVFKFCLNYDGEQDTNNLEFEAVAEGGTPTNQTVDMVAWLPSQTSALAAQRFFRITFDVSQTGSPGTNVLSNEEAIVKQGKAVGIAVEKILDVTGAPKVILIGHSMGGLAARAYLQWGHSGPADPGDFWARRQEGAGGHRVAKLVTLGTPHLGSNLAEVDAALVGRIDSSGNAARDLAHSYYWPFLPDSALFLFGGNESTVPPYFPGTPAPGFYSRDVDCNGVAGNDVLGLNAANGHSDNPLIPLPTDIEYVWVIGDRFDPNGDCAVRADRQYLQSPGESIVIRAAHVRECVLGGCTEAESKDVIVEALDEPDSYVPSFRGGAWPIPESQPGRSVVTGFMTHQWNPDSSQDDDWFSFEVPAGSLQRVSVDLEGTPSGTPHPDVRQLEVQTESGTPLGSASGSGSTALSTEVVVPAGTGPVRILVHVGGTAADFSDLNDPCDSQALSTSAGRAYRLTVSAGSGSVSLNVTPPLVAPGQSTTAEATVRKSDNSSLPGVTVTFSTFLAGQFGGCTPVAGGCQSTTNASGVATVTFTASAAGSGQIAATASTGASASASLTVQQGTSAVTASPNPTFYNQPTTLTATLRSAQGNPVPEGTNVTFSTGFPGRFALANPTCTFSPCSAVTNASGVASLLFTPQSTGTASITVEATGVAAQILQLPVQDPAAGARISVSVQYWGADATSTTYQIAALVLTSAGTPFVGERVYFSSTLGSVSPAYDDTGTGGRAFSLVTVTSSGQLTATASAAGTSASTTIQASVGGGGGVVTLTERRRLWDGRTVYGLAFTPDGSALVAASYSSEVVGSWAVPEWVSRWEASSPNGSNGQVSITTDGTLAAIASEDGMEIRSVANGAYSCIAGNPSGIDARLGTWRGSRSLVNLAVAADSYYHLYRHSSECASGSMVWTVATSTADFDRLAHLGYSPAKGLLAAADDEGKLHVWNTSGGIVHEEAVAGSSADLYDTVFSSDGSKLLVVGEDTFAVVDTTNWTRTNYGAPDAPGWLMGATFIDGDRKVAVGDSGGNVQVVDLASGAPFAKGNIGGVRAAEMAWNEATGDLAVGTVGRGIVILRPLDPPDTAGPVISVTAPSEGLVTKDSSLTTTGLVTDQSQVTGATLNGVALALDGTGAFSATVPLVEGPNTLTYGAADVLGNTSSVTRTVTRVVDRTAPVISGLTVTPPVGPPGTTFVVTCSVVDADTGVATASATVRNAGGSAVGAVTLIKQSGSTYQGSAGSTGYAVGNYTLDVTAVDSSPQANSRTVTGAGSCSVAGSQPLSVTLAGLGTGTVTSAPAGISCGSSCSATFSYGTAVSLSASGTNGSIFRGWSGGPCAGTGPCTVTMSEARSVTATFDPPNQVLTVTKDGAGSGTVSSAPSGVDCGASCSSAFAYGTSVTLTASPASGSVFAGWTGGGCTGSGTCVLTMTQSRSVTATFASNGATRFSTLTPCRLIDTRDATPDGLHAPALAAHPAVRTFVVPANLCGIPSNARAISVNYTITQSGAAGDLQVWATDESLPPVSTVASFGAGKTRANNGILRLPSSGGLSFNARLLSSQQAHIIVDVNGFFSSPDTGETTVNLPGLPAGAKPLVLVRVPVSTYEMGAPDAEWNSTTSERPVHQVTLSEYYVGKYEVTQAQWRTVMGTAMPATCGDNGIGDDYPVYCVSWNDIAGSGGFIEKLRTLTGDSRFRLPTEAEWEGAARAGTRTRFSFGDALDSDDVCGASAAAEPYAWWCGNDTPPGSKPVGTKRPNPLGLHDVHGNLCELVQDLMGSYPAESQTNPTGPTSGSTRVYRGGSRINAIQHARSACRYGYNPAGRHGAIGFRLAR